MVKDVWWKSDLYFFRFLFRMNSSKFQIISYFLRNNYQSHFDSISFSRNSLQRIHIIYPLSTNLGLLTRI